MKMWLKRKKMSQSKKSSQKPEKAWQSIRKHEKTCKSVSKHEKESFRDEIHNTFKPNSQDFLVILGLKISKFLILMVLRYKNSEGK
jgi:hypothetical protein